MATKNLLKTLKEKNLEEAGAEIVTQGTKTLKSELDKDWKIAMQQMLGIREKAQAATQKVEGELKEGEEISFAKSKQEKHTYIEPAIDYRREVINAGTNHLHLENQQLRQQLSEIQAELKKIAEASKEIETEFKEVAKETMQQTVRPGTYHINFFEWMLATIQSARIRIESSASWINAISSKKAKRDYWTLTKSHGTSYSLSSERVVAQQVG